jgi:transposase-like protein
MSGENHYTEISLLEFQDKFPTEESCLDYLIKMRWPQGVKCPCCADSKLDYIRTRRAFECRGCRKQIYVTAGTIFHKSRVPLRKWFWAIFLMATSKKGVSMLYLQKQLGIKSYRTAWLMGHKIRQAMIQRNGLYMLEGMVEADEIFIGGKQSLDERRKAGSNKTPFLIAVQENQEGGPRFLSFEELETIYEQHVAPAIKKHIRSGSTIKSDGDGVYVKASKEGYKHLRSVAMKEPEQTYEHLKWINTITSNLKRYLLSTHHGVFPKYRKAFLAEFAYRFNRRYWPYQAFDRLLYACVHAHPVPLPVLTA